MTPDSKTMTILPETSEGFVYLTSDPLENDWGGQLPISRQSCLPRQSALIDGIYVAAQPPEEKFPMDFDLAGEFAAWEAASDEALQRFEAGLS